DRDDVEPLGVCSARQARLVRTQKSPQNRRQVYAEASADLVIQPLVAAQHMMKLFKADAVGDRGEGVEPGSVFGARVAAPVAIGEVEADLANAWPRPRRQQEIAVRRAQVRHREIGDLTRESAWRGYPVDDLCCAVEHVNPGRVSELM